MAVALESSPASSGRHPGIFSVISITVCTDAVSSPQISTSLSIG